MESKLPCEEMEIFISAYFDNELSAPEVETVKDHLNNCKNCFKYYVKIEELSKLIKRSDVLVQNNCNEIGFDAVSRLHEENITCSEVLEELSAYYDVEVPLKLYYSIDEHLNTCLECSEEYSKLENLSKCLKSSYFHQISNTTEELSIDLNLENLEVCRKMQVDMPASLNDELDEDDSIKFNSHLNECKYCRKDFEELKTTKSTVNNYFHTTKLGNINITSQSKIINIFRRLNNTSKFAVSVAILLVVSISWTNLNTNRLDNSDKSNIEKQKKQIQEQPMFANSQSFIPKYHRQE